MTENQIAVAMEKVRKNVSTKKGEDSLLRQKMYLADENCMDGLMSLPMKSKWAAFWLSFFLGSFGAGRFYIGDKKIGILRIVASVLTGALLLIPILGLIVSAVSGIWLIAEWFLCFNGAKSKNYEALGFYLDSHKKTTSAVAKDVQE